LSKRGKPARPFSRADFGLVFNQIGKPRAAASIVLSGATT
jgi:hypothetical protein